ncbi:cobalt ABC transporter ATPase, partial [Salmonella enterica subsp. enterica]|nr:cobalt ABC transporter ATPase [Salmonella enterica subsp. enterica]EEE3405126.1 cobalt ABC transporter ATPase [Salmonella enterica subsp. enterica]
LHNGAITPRNIIKDTPSDIRP